MRMSAVRMSAVQMSAVQTRAPRRCDLTAPSRRALLLLGATIVLLIAGLLGMHALSGAGMSHGSGVEHGGAIDSTAHAAHASSGALATHGAQQAPTAPGPHGVGTIDAGVAHCGDGCAAPAPGHVPEAPGHAGVAACVLALLAGLLLLVRPASPARSGTLATVRWPALAATAARSSAPAPSLTVLSISRT